MRRFLMALGFIAFLPAVAFASALIDDVLPYERQATVEILDHAGGHGSGVIISGDTILTALHVVPKEDGESYNIKLADGTVITGTVSWRSSTVDAATLIFNKPANIRPAAVSCAPLAAGQAVVAVGWPMTLPLSVGYGHIMSAEPYDTGEGDALILTDAFIAPGMSGGPVYSDGKVVGLVDKGVSSHSMGLFVPINLGLREFCK